MHRLVLILIPLVFLSCRSTPEVFVTTQTDSKIEETKKSIDTIQNNAKTLSDTVDEIKPDKPLTKEQYTVIKETTKAIVKESVKAKEAIVAVETSHKQDNKSASKIVVDLVNQKETNSKLWKWLIGIILAIAVYVTIRVLLRRLV